MGGCDLLMTISLMKKVTGELNLLIPFSLLITTPSREGSPGHLRTRKGLELTPQVLETAVSLGDMREQ